MPFSRRDLIIAAQAAAALSSSTVRLSAATEWGEQEWATVRDGFTLKPGLIYLNAANLCPAPRVVVEQEFAGSRDIHSDPSSQNRQKFDGLRERLRGKLATLLHGQPNEFAIARNTSEANNWIARGVPLKAGDEVIVTAHNHPSNLASWRERAKHEGIVIREVAVPVPATSVEGLAATILDAVNTKTRVITFSHLTNTTGNLYPVKLLADEARRRGIWIHVDGAQSFGLLDVNLAELGIDSYSGSAHKWPMGPLEAGLLWVRQDRVKELWPSVLSVAYYGKHPLEALGQRDDPKLVAFEAAVDFLAKIGMARIEKRSRALSQELMKGLSEIPGVTLKTSREAAVSAAVVKVTWVNADLPKAYQTLWDRHRISCAVTASGDSAGIRLSPHVYNSMEQMDRTVAAVRELARG